MIPHGGTGLTLAEELLLIALDDEKGVDRANWGMGVESGLAGALLLELVALGCVEDEDGDLVAGDCERPAEPLLADAFAAIAEPGRRRSAKGWVSRLPRVLKPLRRRVAERLVERGILAERRSKVLGLVERARWPELDPEPERALRARLREVLTGAAEPTARDRRLVALLEPYDLVKGLVERDERRGAKRRAKDIRREGAVGEAVSDAVRSAEAATMAAVIVASAATSSGGGDGGGGDGGGGG